MNILSQLLWKLALGAGVAAIVVALWFRGDRYAAQAQANQVLLKSAIAIGNANAGAALLNADLSKKISATEAVATIRKQRLRADADLARKEINDAPMEEDGPLAPVLRDQLNRLPESSVASANRDVAAAGDSGLAVAAE